MEFSGVAGAYRRLYRELEDFERKGVDIMMDGSRKSPLQVVTAHMVREEGSYMREYVADEGGNIKSLMFVYISEE